MNRAQGTAGLALVLVAIAAGIWWGRGKPETPPRLAGAVATTSTVSAEFPMITVHVAGLVLRPGLVALAKGSRVADAVAAAGGLLPGAQTESINLAALVTDGEQIVVPGTGGDSPVVGSIGSGDEKIRLNAATAAELDALPGVGPVIAERIVSFRDENGPFKTLEDLLDVPGIGEAKLAELRDRLQVP